MSSNLSHIDSEVLRRPKISPICALERSGMGLAVDPQAASERRECKINVTVIASVGVLPLFECSFRVVLFMAVCAAYGVRSTRQ